MECCLNAVRMFRKQSECSSNTLPMPFDIYSLRMHLESFEHVTRMCTNIWNAHRMQSEFLKCNSIVQEYTTTFHSDGILAHSSTSVTGV